MAEDFFINRVKEMEALMKIFEKVKGGHGRTVFVIGEPGIGKTYFCEKFCSMVKNARVLRGYATEDFSHPYEPIHQAIGEYFEMAKNVGKLEMERISEIIKKRHPQIAGSEEILLNFLSAAYAITKNGHEDVQTAKLRMFEIISRLIHSIASQTPLILFLEDMHWADKSTWNLFHYIARSIENRPVLILATYRNDEVVEPKTGETRAIVEAIQKMRRERLFDEILLGRFSESEALEFVEKYTGVSPSKEVMKNIYAITEGVPLLLKELACYVQSAEKSFEVLPENYTASILKRLSMLSDIEKKVIEVCAVMGEKIDIDVLMKFFDIEDEELLQYLEKFCKINLLTETSSASYKFSHNLLRRTVYKNIKEVKDLHLRVASVMEAMEDYKERRPEVIGHHYMQAGDFQKASAYYFRAGEIALNHYAIDEAKKYFQTAVELSEKSEENKLQIAMAMLHIGNIDMDTGKLEEAKRAYDRVLSLAFELNAKKLSSEAYRKLGKIFEMRGKYESAFAHYKKALESAVECKDLLNIANAYEALGSYCWRVDRLEDAEKFFNACLETASALGEKILIAKAHTGLGNIDLKRGKYGEAIAHFENAMKTLPEKEVPERLRNMNNMAAVFVLMEKYEEAKEKYLEMVKEGEKYGLIRHIASAYVNLGAIYAEQGKLEEAIEACERAQEYAKRISDVYAMTVAKANMAEAIGKKGEIEKFKALICESIAILEELGLRYDVAKLYFEAADLMFSQNRFEEGKEYLKKAYEVAQEIKAEGIIRKIEELKQKYGDKIQGIK